MSRRTPGIHPRVLKDGRKVWDVRVEGPPRPDGGRRFLKFRGLLTYKAAQARRTEVLTALQRGTYVEPTRQTLAEYLGEWLDARRGSLRPSTHQAYTDKIRQYVVPRLGAVPLQRLSAATLNTFYADLLAEGRHRGDGGLSPGTVRYVHTILRKALADAVRWERAARNVADQADPPRARAPEMRTWTAEQVRGFLRHVREDRLYTAWVLLATTGMRRGELLGLRWEDLDVEAARLSIRRALVPAGSALVFSEPKTERGRRSVALDATTVAALREHRKRQAAERLAWGPAYQDQGLVFAAEDGSPLLPARLTRLFNGHARAAGLPRIRLHDLRHTHATLALQAGVHPKVISERLGHAGIVVTLDLYSHAVPALEAQAAEQVAGLIFEGRA